MINQVNNSEISANSICDDNYWQSILADIQYDIYETPQNLPHLTGSLLGLQSFVDQMDPNSSFAKAFSQLLTDTQNGACFAVLDSDFKALNSAPIPQLSPSQMITAVANALTSLEFDILVPNATSNQLQEIKGFLGSFGLIASNSTQDFPQQFNTDFCSIFPAAISNYFADPTNLNCEKILSAIGQLQDDLDS